MIIYRRDRPIQSIGHIIGTMNKPPKLRSAIPTGSTGPIKIPKMNFKSAFKGAKIPKVPKMSGGYF